MTLTLEAANTMISAAFAKAREEGMKPLGISILDAGGHLIAFQREDGASFLRLGISQAKAWTALALQMPSRAYADMAKERPQFAGSLDGISEGKMAASAGGLLIEKDGQTLGAIGVSGDLPDNDEIAAKAGLLAALF
ncbi:MAG: heme-binding protein [Sphingomonadales bacterium]